MASEEMLNDAGLVELKKIPTFGESIKALATSNLYTNILGAVLIPFAFLSFYLHWGDNATFLINLVVIICLAKMLDFTTDQLSKEMGQTLGALVNASFGNAVELIVGVMALRAGQIEVVQSSLLGSILSNLLFVLGFCFFFGGIKFHDQKFNPAAANISSSLLALTTLGFLLPSVFHLTVTDENNKRLSETFSRGTSLLLLFIYIGYMIFQLKTHTELFEAEQEEEESEEMECNTISAIFGLVISTILIGFCAEFLVDSIDGIATSWKISHGFIGLIILPIVGNAAEHVSALFAALRNKMDLAIGVSLGSSLQIAIFVTPILVLVGWIIDQPLTLDFPVFDISVIFATVLIVINLINDAALYVCAQLPPGEVTINQITYQGDGCPQGSVQSVLSTDATVFTLLYGPGVAATENRKECAVIVDLNHSHGYTYTALQLDYRGYVSVPSGLNAELKTSHFFDVEPGNANFQHVFPGPFDNDYLVSLTNPLRQRNPCGPKSRARIRTVVRLFGKNTSTLAGYISGDSLDGNLNTNATRQVFHLDWKKC
ncbi:hypothetical protein HDV06_004711 [Boothiomyces sp. JEL0866]|nr:hypothetical protein HDV06_004711 [Boothiomyces sp. JEL0866]